MHVKNLENIGAHYRRKGRHEGSECVSTISSNGNESEAGARPEEVDQGRYEVESFNSHRGASYLEKDTMLLLLYNQVERLRVF